MKVIAYIRTSNQGRTDTGFGHEAQLKACTQFAENIPDAEFFVYSDLVVSGSIPFNRRKGLSAAVDKLSRGDILVCYKRDRLGRDIIDLSLLQRTVEKKGATIHSLSGEGNGSSYEDGFMRSIIDAASQYERDMIRKRSKAALEIKNKRNEVTGGLLPYGYKLAPDGKHLMPHEREFPILMEIFRLLEQGITPYRISTIISRQGLYGRANGPWSDTSICSIAKRKESMLERIRSESFVRYLKESGIACPYVEMVRV